MPELTLVILGLVLGGLLVGGAFLLLRGLGKKAPEVSTFTTIAERVRSVGRLVGLEVYAKEIATSTKGWGWLPPILLSQARVAFIFHFEKQYSVDLTRLDASDVQELGETDGKPRYAITLPPIEGALRLTDLEPYDIQAGRVLMLLDIIQLNATTQKELIRRAQEQAAELYRRYDAKYQTEARRAIEKHLSALLALFDVEVEIRWRPSLKTDEARDVEVGERVRAATTAR
jgi:hypothetical protein